MEEYGRKPSIEELKLKDLAEQKLKAMRESLAPRDGSGKPSIEEQKRSALEPSQGSKEWAMRHFHSVTGAGKSRIQPESGNDSGKKAVRKGGMGGIK